MHAAPLAPRSTLDATQLQAALTDLLIHERVVVEARAHALQVYAAAAARDIPVHLPRGVDTAWTIEAAI